MRRRALVSLALSATLVPAAAHAQSASLAPTPCPMGTMEDYIALGPEGCSVANLILADLSIRPLDGMTAADIAVRPYLGSDAGMPFVGFRFLTPTMRLEHTPADPPILSATKGYIMSFRPVGATVSSVALVDYQGGVALPYGTLIGTSWTEMQNTSGPLYLWAGTWWNNFRGVYDACQARGSAGPVGCTTGDARASYTPASTADRLTFQAGLSLSTTTSPIPGWGQIVAELPDAEFRVYGGIVTPEPSTLALSGAGCLALCVGLRRRARPTPGA
jgi:hypothetical protein